MNYFTVKNNQIVHNSGGVVPIPGLKSQFIEQAMEALQISDEKWANFNSSEEDWRKRRVVEAQLKVLANYSQCRHRLTTDDLLTLTALSSFLSTRLDEPAPPEGMKTSYVYSVDDNVLTTLLEYDGNYWQITPVPPKEQSDKLETIELRLQKLLDKGVELKLPDEQILNELLEMGLKAEEAAKKMSETATQIAQKIKNRIEDSKSIPDRY